MSKLLDKLLKSGKIESASMLADSPYFNDRDIVKTDLPILNIALGGSLDGGLTSGITVLSGDSKTLKTILALFMISAYLKHYPESALLYYDNEAGSTKKYFKSVGVKDEQVIYLPVQCVEDVTLDIVDRLKDVKRGDKVAIFVDSIGSMPTNGEIVKAEDGKTTADMGKRAQVIRSFFRILNSQTFVKDLPSVIIAHKYKTMETYSQDVVSGGTAVTLFAQNLFILSKSQVKEKIKNADGKASDTLVGYEYCININKSRFSKEKTRLQFELLWDEGIKRYSGLLELAIESGHINKNNAQSFSKVNMETGEVEDKKYRRKDTNNKEFWTSIMNDPTFNDYIKSRYQLSDTELLDSDIDTAYKELEVE